MGEPTCNASTLLVSINFHHSNMAAVKCSTASFLDHAWVAQSPIATQPSKTARTHRKQNRCCDQCRKGKRACDATILEDSLLDANPPCGRDQKLFHYSGMFLWRASCKGKTLTLRQISSVHWLPVEIVKRPERNARSNGCDHNEFRKQSHSPSPLLHPRSVEKATPPKNALDNRRRWRRLRKCRNRLSSIMKT